MQLPWGLVSGQRRGSSLPLHESSAAVPPHAFKLHGGEREGATEGAVSPVHSARGVCYDRGDPTPPADESEEQRLESRGEVGESSNKKERKGKKLVTSEKTLRRLRLFFLLCVGVVATHFVALAYAKSLENEEMTAYRADVVFLQTTVFNQLIASDGESDIIRVAMQTWGSNLTLDQYSELTAPGTTSEGKSIAYAARVPAEARPEVEAAASALYGQGIFFKDLSPTGFVVRANITEGEDYWPITHVEPRNDRIVGFDVASESVRRAAAERAVSTEKIAYTKPIANDGGEISFSKILTVRGGPSLLSSSSSAADGSPGGSGDDVTGLLVVFVRAERELEQSSLQKFESSYPGTQVDIGFLASDGSRASLHGVPFTDASGKGSSKTILGSKATSDVETTFYVETASVPRPLEKRGLPWEYFAVLSGGVLLFSLLCYWEHRSFLLRAAMKEEAAAAREASSAKSCFLRSITHEIRTPMNGIVGMAQVLESVDLPDSARPYVNVIHSCSATLLSLVNNILDMSKIEAGKIEISNRSFALDTLAVEMVESAWTVLHTCGTSSLSSMSLTIGSSVPRGRVVGDDVRIRQLFNNFIGNAVKFTRQGSVDLFLDATQTSGESEEVMILLTVRDTGIGMAPDAVERLFKPFVQVHDTTTTNVQGTGLGLAISFALAQAMGGDVTCSSVLGKGSEFRCTFKVEGKLHEATTVAHRRVYTRDDGVRVEGEPLIPTGNEDTCDRSGTSATPREGEAHRGLLRGSSGDDPRPPRVLVVDDNKINRMVLSKLLGSLGLPVESAGTGLQAVESCGLQRFSVILLDKVMPVMDGIDAAKELRAGDGPCKDTPIIFLTADGSTEAIRECRQAGGSDFITKPVRRETLVEKMAGVLPPPERSWLLDKEREFCESRKQATHLQGMGRIRPEESSTRNREEDGDGRRRVED